MRVIVAGVHRSGTSAVAGLVRQLLDIGEGPVMESQYDNPRGFHERADIAIFNDEWLNRFGACWWAPKVVDAKSFAAVPEADIVEARRRIDLATAPGDWFVKDPRMSLLLPLWDRLTLEHLPVIACVRDPLSVADSLNLRNGFTLRRSLAIWSRYMTGLLEAADRRSLVLDYDKALADPVGTAELILAFLDRPIVGAAELSKSLEPDLKRSMPMNPGTSSEFAPLLALYEQISEQHGQPLPLAHAYEEPAWVTDLCHELSSQWQLEQQQVVTVSPPPEPVPTENLALLEELTRRAEHGAASQDQAVSKLDELLTGVKDGFFDAQRMITAGAEGAIGTLAAALRAESAHREELFDQLIKAQREATAQDARLSAEAVRSEQLSKDLLVANRQREESLAEAAELTAALRLAEQAAEVLRTGHDDLKRTAATAETLAKQVEELEELVGRQLQALAVVAAQVETTEELLAASRQELASTRAEHTRAAADRQAAAEVLRRREADVLSMERELVDLRAASTSLQTEVLVLQRMCDVAEVALAEGLADERDRAASRVMRLAARLRRRTGSRGTDA